MQGTIKSLGGELPGPPQHEQAAANTTVLLRRQFPAPVQVRCAVISGKCGSGLPLEAHCGSGRQTRKLLTVSSRLLEAAAVTVQATVQLRADRIAGNDQQVDQKAARADLGN